MTECACVPCDICVRVTECACVSVWVQLCMCTCVSIRVVYERLYLTFVLVSLLYFQSSSLPHITSRYNTSPHVTPRHVISYPLTLTPPPPQWLLMPPGIDPHTWQLPASHPACSRTPPSSPQHQRPLNLMTAGDYGIGI